ncbi:membrane protein [Salmonella enterica subsp. enterica]|uniref:Membrane protein n=1 Tax=Salmonella enterica I TaxID=59201 RepID=A0A3S4LYD2_SALET|nr:membrane protein [Salmonella enterica subsp. enterica]
MFHRKTSFIHPRGHERGWSQIAENFYGTTMGKTFSKRTLKLDAPPAIHVYGNAAVAEFDWHFTAVRRDNGQTQHTTGRESQVWAKIPNTGMANRSCPLLRSSQNRRWRRLLSFALQVMAQMNILRLLRQTQVS